MNAWSESNIAIVYFSGLFFALMSGLVIVFYLNSIKEAIKLITIKFNKLWNSIFKSSIVLASLIGALSINFRNCEGNYDYLLKSPQQTVIKGIEQVSNSFDWLTVLLGFWFLLFIILRLNSIKNIENKTKVL
ncbi:MAG TPA: hypothetical protein VIS27_12450 [Yeosuana sp.]